MNKIVKRPGYNLNHLKDNTVFKTKGIYLFKKSFVIKKKIEEQGGLYHVTIRNDFNLGVRISIHKLSRLGIFRLEQTTKLIEVFI